MPRRNQREVVAERTEALLDEQQQHCRGAAQCGSQTRRQRREQQTSEPQPQIEALSGTPGNVVRNTRDRVHADLLTVAIRGPFAQKMRALSESTGMSLAKMLKDALLVYTRNIHDGYEPGTAFADWELE